MRVIVITGGSRGIGASTALECASRGMGVILTYHQQASAAEAVVDKILQAGGRACALALDVAETSAFEAFGDTVREQLATVWKTASLSGLVNNAGYGLYNPIERVSEAQFDGL